MAKKTTENTTTEIRIGLTDAPHELHIETQEDPKEIATNISEALNKGNVFTITDSKNRQIFLAANKITFVEIGESTVRKVGFAAN